MERRKGYEWSYDLSFLDESMAWEYPCWVACLTDKEERYLFEIRANMKLKLRETGEKEKLGIEKFGVWAWKDKEQREVQLLAATTPRLKDDYWMTDEQIRRMFGAAMDFAKQAEAQGRSLPFAVVVELDVVTVQGERESRRSAYRRSIRPDCLIPLEKMCWTIIPGGEKTRDPRKKSLWVRENFLLYLPRKRVEEESGLKCCVCRGKLVVGKQVSFLPCEHAYHPRCLYNWLKREKSNCSFPSCNREIPHD